MAQVTIRELRQLVHDHTSWRASGWESPFSTLSVGFPNDPRNQAESGTGVFAPERARKTITYESRDTSVVLDFDESGYLCNIEFV